MLCAEKCWPNQLWCGVFSAYSTGSVASPPSSSSENALNRPTSVPKRNKDPSIQTSIWISGYPWLNFTIAARHDTQGGSETAIVILPVLPVLLVWFKGIWLSRSFSIAAKALNSAHAVRSTRSHVIPPVPPGFTDGVPTVPLFRRCRLPWQLSSAYSMTQSTFLKDSCLFLDGTALPQLAAMWQCASSSQLPIAPKVIVCKVSRFGLAFFISDAPVTALSCKRGSSSRRRAGRVSTKTPSSRVP